MSGMLARFSPPEIFMLAGAVLILVIDLVAIFGDYAFSNVAWISAALALILIVLNGRLFQLSANTYRTALIVIGLLAALIGVRELLADLAFIPGRSLSASFFLGMVGFYVGVALLVYGAFLFWKSKSA